MNHPASPEVVETTLPNGMKLLLKEDHTAPIASLWTWYRVGSRNAVSYTHLTLPTILLV